MAPLSTGTTERATAAGTRARLPPTRSCKSPSAPLVHIADPALRARAAACAEADARLAPMIDDALLDRLGSMVPTAWADPAPYVDFLHTRVNGPRPFVEEAAHGRP